MRRRSTLALSALFGLVAPLVGRPAASHASRRGSRPGLVDTSGVTIDQIAYSPSFTGLPATTLVGVQRIVFAPESFLEIVYTGPVLFIVEHGSLEVRHWPPAMTITEAGSSQGGASDVATLRRLRRPGRRSRSPRARR